MSTQQYPFTLRSRGVNNAKERRGKECTGLSDISNMEMETEICEKAEKVTEKSHTEIIQRHSPRGTT